MKDKKHMVISIDAESFEKNSTCIYEKTPLERMEGIYIKIIKGIYDQPTANMMLNGEKLKALPFKWRRRQECRFSLLLFNIVF